MSFIDPVEVIYHIQNDFASSQLFSYQDKQEILLFEYLSLIEGLLIYRVLGNYEGGTKGTFEYLYSIVENDPSLYLKYQNELSLLKVTERCLYWLTDFGKMRLRLTLVDEFMEHDDLESLIIRFYDTDEETKSKLELIQLYHNLQNRKYW